MFEVAGEKEAIYAYQIIFILESVMKIGNPAAISADKDVSLFVEACSFGSFKHNPFVENLHGIDTFSLTEFHDANFTEGTSPNDFDDFEVFA